MKCLVASTAYDPRIEPWIACHEMGFDGMILKSVLESFVDDIAEESTELILERPRYAYAVVVIADDHEMCEASCVRQLDVEIFQTQNSTV
ncbi:hypothetical protein TELCIR_10255 [Teladorsagia circumcincta]|uniref:Uncharacterized protein n=1 Tax=Teladorsagia circumcincta TaxID=45464 RepID=A0A2G9UCL4_TELCI|nr:hypothetical protein TELCIR_10255 [Teladorsagia circumcincta]